MYPEQPKLDAKYATASDSRIRVLCADDHPLIRDGIAFALEQEQDIELVGQVADGRDAIEAYKHLRPDVVIMDLQMPGTSGLEALITIRKDFPQARVIILTTYSGDMQATTALKHGAYSYLLKDMAGTHLVDSIRSAHAGHRTIPTEVAAGLAQHLVSEQLSPREIDVLRGAAAGCSNKMIAKRLDLTEQTVKGYMKSTFAKLGANDRTHAVMIAMKRGFLES